MVNALALTGILRKSTRTPSPKPASPNHLVFRAALTSTTARAVVVVLLSAMKTLNTILLAGILLTPGNSHAVDGGEVVTLDEARELGRKSSTILKRTLSGLQTQGEAPPNETPKPNTAFFRSSVLPAFRKSCLACHGPDHSEGRLRVDQLNPDLLKGADIAQWREIYNVLSNSEMPPKDEADFALADNDRAKIVDWLSAELNKASIVRRNDQKNSSFRRLTKYEFDYALQDLLGLKHSVAGKLPPETASEDGFKNSSELLQMSAMQFQTYREIAIKALRRACVVGDRPAPVTYIISMEDELTRATAPENAKTFNSNDDNYRNHARRVHLLNQESGLGIQFSGGNPKPVTDATVAEKISPSPVTLVMPRNAELKLNLDRFLPDEGIMRVRIRASRSTEELQGDACLQLTFSAHTSNNANFSNTIGERDVRVTAPANQPEFIDFHISLADIQRNPFRKLETRFPRRDEFLHIRNLTFTEGLNVLIDHIEISAPFYERWPPQSHQAVFFDSANKGNEESYAREVLGRFVRRAWGRSANSEELSQLMGLFNRHRSEFETFEEAMLEVLATVLTHPEFLYLVQEGHRDSGNTPAAISQQELAGRLSTFLWASIPDEELLRYADQEKLKDPGVLRSQVERMLGDKRSHRFTRHFVQQWLGLDGLNSVTHITDSQLKHAMLDEPVAFFEEAIRHNSSVMDFLHSDYALVNERLARHYGIRDVHGVRFRKVHVDVNQNRGGILTSAAVLAMNSDGKHSNPLKRGVWMLERVLHDPPPPPPPNVPEVDLTDPRILEMTLKERIADHRNKPACASCHSRIDPWGIAFENYDALGSFRTQVGGKPIDATSELFGKQILAGMGGLKRYLLMERQDQFARAMVHKLTSYALGRSLTFGDRVELEKMAGKLRSGGDGLRDLIHLVVNSDLFHTN